MEEVASTPGEVPDRSIDRELALATDNISILRLAQHQMISTRLHGGTGIFMLDLLLTRRSGTRPSILADPATAALLQTQSAYPK